MSDLISRQEAIDALKEHRALYCDNTPDAFSELPNTLKSRVDELDAAIATIVNLPSAEPKTGKGLGKNEMALLISMMAYAQGVCDSKSRKAADMLQEGIDMLIDKVDGESDLQSEHKNGVWLETEFLKLRECSCCHVRWGMYDIENFTFCPNCGAKMRAE